MSIIIKSLIEPIRIQRNGEAPERFMNLEKRIKRHVVGREHELFAVTLPGFEHLCADELETLSDTIRVAAVLNGGVRFHGRLTDIYRVNLQLRTASRILLRLGSFKATNFNQLLNRTQKIAWELYLGPGVLPKMNVTAHHSRLYHTQAVAEHIARSVAARWSELGMATHSDIKQRVFVRLQDDVITLSLDSSGAALYQRGLKTHKAHAPLRETMAAAILKVAGFRDDRPLLDPMCGSGTFSLEAALLCKNIPPGWYRDFSFMHWPAFRPQQWEHLKKIAGRAIHRRQAPLILASDHNEKAVTLLSDCIKQNKLGDAIKVSREDFFNIEPENIIGTPGLVVLNPPYGQRLNGNKDVNKQYNDISAKIREDFKGWRVALIVPKRISIQSLGLPLKPSRLVHGGLDLTLLIGKI